MATNPTNGDAIKDLEAAKAAMEDESGKASGQKLALLVLATQRIADEIGELVTSALDTAPYVPRTDAFTKITEEATAFVKTLNDIKTAFAAVAAVAKAADTVLGFIK